MSNESPKGPLIIAGLVALLLILHQDNWLWENETLVFGFMPIGLLYHACISIAASVTWFLATRIAWPVDETGEQVRQPDQSNDTSGDQP